MRRGGARQVGQRHRSARRQLGGVRGRGGDPRAPCHARALAQLLHVVPSLTTDRDPALATATSDGPLVATATVSAGRVDVKSAGADAVGHGGTGNLFTVPGAVMLVASAAASAYTLTPPSVEIVPSGGVVQNGVLKVNPEQRLPLDGARLVRRSADGPLRLWAAAGCFSQPFPSLPAGARPHGQAAAGGGGLGPAARPQAPHLQTHGRRGEPDVHAGGDAVGQAVGPDRIDEN